MPTVSAGESRRIKRLSDICSAASLSPVDRQAKLLRISDHVVRNSRAIDAPNFTQIARRDLETMVEAYDAEFFDSCCAAAAREHALAFRLSSRMTSAGGKTTRTIYPPMRNRPGRIDYEIALSTTLLFQTFRDDSRPIRVCGLTCGDRLAAMMRIVEHELIHLAEMLVWVHSDCAAKRFQGIANRLFGHTEHRHELVTQRERARTEFNIRLGDRVTFVIAGQKLHGIVNRITRRATVLVANPAGELFSDGQRYVRYYVPLPQLKRLEKTGA